MKSNQETILHSVLVFGVVLLSACGAFEENSTPAAAVAAGIQPNSITIDSSGKFAYASSYYGDSPINEGAVSQYTIGINGALIPNATAIMVAAGTDPESITIDPSGRYVYVANFGNDYKNGSVSQYTIGNDGALTPNSPATVAAGKSPKSITVHPSGKFAYVANEGNDSKYGTVSQYTIGKNGALIPNSPAKVAAGISPSAVIVDPSGEFAYVTNNGDGKNEGTVSQYTIGRNGALAPNFPPTVAAGSQSSSITIDPSGKFAYVANRYGGNSIDEGVVSQYTIGRNGALTPNSPATVATGEYPVSITVDPSGKYAYVANWGDGKKTGTVSQYMIGRNGALTPNSPATVAAGIKPTSVAFDPLGKFAYVVNGGDDKIDGTVSQYIIGVNGALTPVTTAATVSVAPGSSLSAIFFVSSCSGIYLRSCTVANHRKVEMQEHFATPLFSRSI